MRRLPWGETVTVISRTATGVKNADGNDTYATGSVEYEGVPVWPIDNNGWLAGQEKTDARNQVVEGLNVFLPYDAVVDALSAIYVYGQKYEVNGAAARYRNPYTGTKAGRLVGLQRVTG